ncbi:hypothetical protein Pcinc_000575 [Petrolisthes cinctipes]|uniref:Uncharacterized protein n=1 Tax=Petrolisthes cinctipes TaxID=88211 RepID=A0AAE1GP75_PETCI|nr:hypothetical protein Pcinc_000575 [Petrolisthes cinctipes]
MLQELNQARAPWGVGTYEAVTNGLDSNETLSQLSMVISVAGQPEPLTTYLPPLTSMKCPLILSSSSEGGPSNLLRRDTGSAIHNGNAISKKSDKENTESESRMATETSPTGYCG